MVLRSFRSIALVLPIVSVFPALHAATFYVDASVGASGNGTSWATALKTIQEGIDRASDGDTVIVAPGTYTENIVFGQENLVLRGTNPLDPLVAADTIIDGGGVDSCVIITDLQGPETVISGFTITNGSAEYGGGIRGYIYGYPSARIERNRILNNSAGSGGGLYRCYGVIQDNTISFNEASYGGALLSCGGTIRDNVISLNTASMNGGGLHSCPGTITNNRIQGNEATSGAGGGLAWCGGLIVGNIICENEAGHYGGGLASCTGTVMGNLIWSNSATEGGGGLANCSEAIIQSNVICYNLSATEGGAIYANSGPVLNNTIVGNSAPRGGGLRSCSGVVSNCILWGNTAPVSPQLEPGSLPSYCCIQGWTGGGENNTTTNPLFVDPDGEDGNPSTCGDNNYRLTAGPTFTSPCIDTGDNSALHRPGLDADGNLRITCGKTTCRNPIVDMGAYEHSALPFSIIALNYETSGDVTLTWNSQAHENYIVLSCRGFPSPSWTEEETVRSEGSQTTWTDPAGKISMKSYRIQMVLE